MLPHFTIALAFRPNRWRNRVPWLALFFAMTTVSLYSQKPQPNPNPQPPPPSPPPVFRDSKAPDYGPPPPSTPTFEDMQNRRYIVYRLKSVNTDTKKLLKLAQELNRKIETSGPGSLSSDDLRMVAEIGKLAHSVKWKMQLAIDGNHAP